MQHFYLSSKDFIGEIKLSSKAAIVAHKYKLDFERKQLIKISEFCWNAKVKVEILAVDSVKETLTGRNIPIIVVSSSAEDNQCSSSTCYVIFVDFENDQFIPLRKFDVNLNKLFSKHGEGDRRPISNHIYLLDGPCVAFCQKPELQVYYVTFGTELEQFTFNIKRLKEGTCRCCCDAELTIKYQKLLETRNINDKYLFFMQLQLRSKCTGHGSEVKSIVRVLQFSRKQFSVLNEEQFFPSEYNECLSSIHVKHLEHIDGEQFNSELYLGTSEGFIVHLKNGNILHCNSLFENCAVTCLKMGKCCFEDSARILAGTEGVCNEMTSELQVKEQYSGIMHVLMGDFYQDCSFQYLLLKHDLSERSSWVLTDLKARVLTSEEGEQHQASGSSNTAIKALKSRLQREQILLHEEELQARRTTGFMSDMFRKQLSIAAGVYPDTATLQPNMMSLIEGKECNKCEGHKNQHETRGKQAVEVKGHWQRTYEESWCVGVDIVCNSNRSTKVWLDVVLDESHTSTLTMNSSCLTLSANQTGSNPDMSQIMSAGTIHVGNQGGDMVPTKRQKFTENGSERSSRKSFPSNYLDSVDIQNVKDTVDIEAGTVVCVLPVPVFGHSNKLVANLILNWTHKGQKKADIENVTAQLGAGREDGRKGEGDSDRIYTLCCGRVTLNSKDILDARYELNLSVTSDEEDQEMEDFKEMRNNQLAWQHIQTVHTLVVKGNPGILARFESLLTFTCGFVYNRHYDCYVAMVKALGTVQIQLEPRTSDDSRMMKVYTRNDKDLFLTIHHLYAHLPDHVVILPRENSPAETVRKCLPALQKEADFLSHGLRKLLNDHDAENASMDADDDNDDSDLRKVGEKFKRKRERMLQKQNDIMKDEKVKQFMDKYRRVQDLTDLAMATGGNIK